jgi:hypothetical protein
LRPHQLAQPPLDSIAVDDLVPVLRNDYPDPWMQQQGSGYPSFESLGLYSLPCTSYSFEIGLARQPGTARKAKRLRRRRIWTAVELSAVCAPSSDDG